MTDQNPQNAETIDTRAPKKPAGSRRRRWIVGGVLAIVGLAGVGAISASSHSGFGGHGWRSFDPAKMESRIDFGTDLVLGRAGANPEQRQKVATIIKATLKEVPEFRRANLEARQKLVELMKADKIDRVALERLRAERVQAVELASKKMTQALADAGDILTAEQRRELVSLMEKRRAMGFGR